MPEMAAGLEDIPDGAIVETAHRDVHEAGIPQETAKEQAAEEADVHAVVAVRAHILRLRWHLRSQQRQKPPWEVPEIRHRGHQCPAGLQHAKELPRRLQRIEKVLEDLNA